MNLNIVKKRLVEFRLHINGDKRIFNKEEVDFFGYRISHNKIFPTLKRSEAIANYGKPRNKRAVRRFSGMANYDRTVVPKLLEPGKPLYESIERKYFKWTKKKTKHSMILRTIGRKH